MPYATRRRARRSYRRNTGARKTSTRTRRTYRRSYTARTPRYRKRRTMPKRRILNLTSRKKRDQMAPISNMLGGSPAPTAELRAPALFSTTADGIVPMFVWIPTARAAQDFSNSPGMVHNPTVRTAHTTYMVGLSENLLFQTSSATPWNWRRICFTYKGSDLWPDAPSLDPADHPYYREDSSGYARLWAVPSATNRAAIYSILFKGAGGGIDWTTSHPGLLNAKVDTTRVNLKYDKVRRITSGNDAGVIKRFKMWHPMRKNLRYDEDEEGDYTESVPLSTTSHLGMGDYYVIDIFISLLGSGINDQFSINSTSTLYWHER